MCQDALVSTGKRHPMKKEMENSDTRVLRLANELRRRVKKKATKLKAQRPTDPEQLARQERARVAVQAVSRRLKDVISSLEVRRATFSRLVDLSRENQL